ncbi:uncharacterized protein TRAVEDRAFT_143777 [Trametes versicolor FP-101664 SS1]|uniref:uncharacterized protein n=1 Tax=Trametes versicolor (strain FP-101664) TaxID=717944 RepID=UPI0004622D78|nr:uncharacterized protein TRAVEDRAFT_143777 [Trametes versicolor FP-101664 SS1]EIW61713.1 hypothetical protein TRAVEDRAFT_143777 [Trametes versicolor FP-101664 SS1]
MASNEVLSWTSQDPRDSQLFGSYGVLYRFQTDRNNQGQTVTTLWRAIRANKEDRVAKLEWAPGGGLGRAVIGKSTLPMSDLVRIDPRHYNSRVFNGPDGYEYRWRQTTNTYNDIELLDQNENIIAFYRPTRPQRYNIGEVYGELHFVRNAGAGVVMHPPLMDTVTVTAMLYRWVVVYGGGAPS